MAFTLKRRAGKTVISVTPRRVLLIGDYDHGDFHRAVGWLRAHAELGCVADAPSAVRRLAPPAPPFDLCLLAQARPGRFRQDQIEQLHRAAPLARLALLVGSWCEGETRTGAPPSGVIRIYWHEWESRIAVGWMTGRNAEMVSWLLPRTTLTSERTLAGASVTASERSVLVAVRARSAASFGALSDVCRAADYSAVWLSPEQPLRAPRVGALLWEGDVRQERERNELARLARALAPAPALALLNFPRREDERLARASGAAGIVAKPFLLSDLIGRLRLALASTSGTAAHERS